MHSIPTTLAWITAAVLLGVPFVLALIALGQWAIMSIFMELNHF